MKLLRALVLSHGFVAAVADMSQADEARADVAKEGADQLAITQQIEHAEEAIKMAKEKGSKSAAISKRTYSSMKTEQEKNDDKTNAQKDKFTADARMKRNQYKQQLRKAMFMESQISDEMSGMDQQTNQYMQMKVKKDEIAIQVAQAKLGVTKTELQIAQINGGTVAIAVAQRKYYEAQKMMESMEGFKKEDEAGARKDAQANLDAQRKERASKEKTEMNAKGERVKAEKGRKLEEAQVKSSEAIAKVNRRKVERLTKDSAEKGRKTSEAGEKTQALGRATSSADRNKISKLLQAKQRADERIAKAQESFASMDEDAEDAKKKSTAEAEREVADMKSHAEDLMSESKQEAAVKISESQVAKAKAEEQKIKIGAEISKSTKAKMLKAKADIAKVTNQNLENMNNSLWKAAENEGGPALKRAEHEKAELEGLQKTAKTLKAQEKEEDKSENSWLTVFGAGLIALLLVAVGLYIMSHRLRKQRDYHTKMIVKLNQERIQNQKKIRELGNPLMDGEGSPTLSPDLKSIGQGDRAYWGMS